MSDRPAERGEPEPQEGDEDFEPVALAGGGHIDCMFAHLRGRRAFVDRQDAF